MSEINSKKRILFIITQSEMGGAQRFLYNLLTQINSRYDIRIAVGSDGGNELIEKIKLLNIEVSILVNLKRDMSPVNDIKACFEIRDLINEFKPNTLFLLSSKAGFLGSLASRFLIDQSSLVIGHSSLKVIYRIGGWSFNDPGPAWKKKLWVNLERISASWKDVIIVNNEHDYNQAKKLKIKPREKLAIIYNGLDIYKMEFIPREEARLKLFEKVSRHSGRIFQTETIIGTIANLYTTKGLTTLIEAVEHFKHNDTITFFVIGEGSEHTALEGLIKKKGLEKKVYLLGDIPDAKVYLQAFDVFVLPSLKEGFPWALIEAMAARLPVIATRVGAVPEIIENGENGFITEPGRPEQIAKKITEILSSDYLKKEFSIKAHQTVLFKFSEDKMIKEIEEIL